MIAENELKMLSTETAEEFILRICCLRKSKRLYWEEVAKIINKELGLNYAESKYRREYKAFLETTPPEKIQAMETQQTATMEEEHISSQNDEAFVDYEKQKIKYSDMRNSLFRNIRREARVEENRSLVEDYAYYMGREKPLQFANPLVTQEDVSGKAGILCLSDVHYGIAFKNFLNEYSPEIAIERMKSLTEQTIQYCLQQGVRHLYVTNLGDLIAGAIHLQIRLESRENVIQQTMKMGEILAEMLNELSKYFTVIYYDCLDNHSRIDANKTNAVTMESFALFIPWYLKSRLKDNHNIIINEPTVDNDLIIFEVLGHNIIGAHGHKDSPKNVVSSLTCLTQQHYELALLGHKHHFAIDEQHGTLIVQNGTLMGTDEYAKDLRISSKPTQNLIIVTAKNACECVYRICV